MTASSHAYIARLADNVARQTLVQQPIPSFLHHQAFSHNSNLEGPDINLPGFGDLALRVCVARSVHLRRTRPGTAGPVPMAVPAALYGLHGLAR